MAQNIVSAWLCGARFIELKTVQTLDELEISKPCIDAQDEGYNADRSQELKVEGAGDAFRADRRFQIAVVTDFCNECGNYATFCPTAGRPYRDKPRLYLDFGEFVKEKDNAFLMTRGEGAWTMRGRFGGETHTLEAGKDLVYSAGAWRVRLRAETCEIVEATVAGAREGERLDLEPFARLYALARGLQESQPHLPSADPG